MTDPALPERPLKEAEDPADAHARTLAELVQEDAARERDQAAAVFGIRPDDQHGENHGAD